MTIPTEQDLLDAIEAFLPDPKQPGEMTIHEIRRLKGISEYKAQKAIDAMLAAGIVTVRDYIASNGKAGKYYRFKVS